MSIVGVAWRMKHGHAVYHNDKYGISFEYDKSLLSSEDSGLISHNIDLIRPARSSGGARFFEVSSGAAWYEGKDLTKRCPAWVVVNGRGKYCEVKGVYRGGSTVDASLNRAVSREVMVIAKETLCSVYIVGANQEE